MTQTAEKIPIMTARSTAKVLEAQLEERLQNPTYVWGIPWGWPTLDRKTGGIQRNEMTILIARPGVGKSAFAGKVALNVAQHFKDEGKGRVVRIVSLEMDFPTWQKRLACYLADVPVELIDSGFASAEQVKRYKTGLQELAGLPLECIDQEISLTRIEQFVRYQGTCGFWVLDHIGIVPSIDPKNQAGSLASISNTLRVLTREVAPSLVLSQMNRKSEERQDKRPTASDVYGSDYIVQNARRIFGLYREDIYLRLSEDEKKQPQPSELIIIKANNGQTGMIDMVFHPARLDWAEVETGR